MKFRSYYRLTAVFTVLLLIATPCAVWAQTPGNGIDLVLLIDSSGSTTDTDPEQLRLQGAEFLLEYVQAVGEAQGVTHRFAAANFNAQTSDETGWIWLQGDAGRGQLVARSTGGTDFGPALEYALALRRDSGDTQPMPIVLFTDGAPCSTSPCPVGPALETYFQGLSPTVAALQAAGAQIFVVAIGEDAAQADGYWEDLLGAEHYERITDMRELFGIYRRWLAGWLGLVEDEQGTHIVAAGETLTVMVEPYLEHLVISIFPDNAQTRVEVRNPAGDLVAPARAEGWVYVNAPTRSEEWGAWEVRVTGAGARVWVDRRYATLQLDAPAEPQALGGALDITGYLFRSGISMSHPDLHLSVAAIAPSGESATFPLTRKSDGRYTGVIQNLREEGSYALELSGVWGDDQAVGAHQTTPVTVNLYPVPTIVTCDYGPTDALLVSQSLTVTARITHADRIGPETEVFARLLRADGSTEVTPALRDDGRAPDVQAGDGLFAALVPLPEVAGRYRLACVLQGVTGDGVRLDSTSDTFGLDVSRPAPEATVTSTPRATFTPILTPTGTDTPRFTEADLEQSRREGLGSGLLFSGLIGVIAVLVVAGYLIWRYRKQLKALLAQLGIVKNERDNWEVMARIQEARADKAEFSLATALAKRERLVPKIWDLRRERNSETARADGAEAERDGEKARADRAEAERKQYLDRLTHQQRILELIQQQRATTLPLEKMKLSDEIAQEITEDLQEHDLVALGQAGDSFADALSSIREKLQQLRAEIKETPVDTNAYSEKTKEKEELEGKYLEFIGKQANSTEYAIVKALAKNIVYHQDQLRAIGDIVSDLYWVLGSEGSSQSLLLKAMTEVENTSIASLCILLQDALSTPEPAYGIIVRGIERHLGQSGRNLQAIYHLMGALARVPLVEVSVVQEMWQQALRDAEITGLEALLEALRELRSYFTLDSGARDKEWYECHMRQLSKGKQRLRILCSQKGLPELVILHNILDKWYAYAEALAREGESSDPDRVKIEIRPSLALNWLKRFENPYFYEEVYEKELWLLQVPVVVYNVGSYLFPKVELTMKCVRGTADLEYEAALPIIGLEAMQADRRIFAVRAAQSANLEIAAFNKNIHLTTASPDTASKQGDVLLPTRKKFADEIISLLKTPGASVKQRTVFLRGMSGIGRTKVLGYVVEQFANEDNFVAIHLDLQTMRQEVAEDRFRQVVWRNLLEQIQATINTELDLPGEIAGNELPALVEKALQSKALLVAIDGMDDLLNLKDNWLSLEFLAEMPHGMVVAALDGAVQTACLWHAPFTDYPIALLEEEETKQLVAEKHRSLTALGQRAVWIYSGGHPGFITQLCEQLPDEDTNAGIPVGLDEVKKAVQKLLGHQPVKNWYYSFSEPARCVLSTLASERFVQAETGLLLGLRYPKKALDGNWDGIGRLQHILQERYSKRAQWQVETPRLLEEFLQRQIIERYDDQTGMLRWRMGWVYVKAQSVIVK